MKSIQIYGLLLAATLILASACKTTTKVPAYSPVGTWNYTVKDTPMGDASGSFTITKTGDTYAGTISSDEGTGDLGSLVIDENNMMKSSFMAQGYQVEFSGQFSGETFTGTAAVEGFEFEVVGNRVSQ